MLALRLPQEAESQRSAPTDTASSDGGSGALDPTAKGPRLSVNEYAAWMGTYPGMEFKLPTSQGVPPAAEQACVSIGTALLTAPRAIPPRHRRL
jgi:hypothetical protein